VVYSNGSNEEYDNLSAGADIYMKAAAKSLTYQYKDSENS
jgi:hypothetical protein